MMKWHHYAGLLFGVITLTWTYSGLLSMGPFNWFQPDGGRGRQRARDWRRRTAGAGHHFARHCPGGAGGDVNVACAEDRSN